MNEAKENALVLLGAQPESKDKRNINLKFLLILVLILSLTIYWQLVIVYLSVFLASIVSRKINQNRKIASLEKDLPAFLIALSSSIRCGVDPLQALLGTADLFPEESEIFRIINKSKNLIREAKPLDEVISRFGEGVNYPDLQLFRDAFDLAKNQGSGLSEVLQRIARFIRNRQSFRRKTKAALAMQKLSAIGILVLVIILIIIQFTTNKEILLAAWNHELGSRLLMLSAGLILAGVSCVFLINNSESR